MARILAFDYGKKRVGIAVSDPLQIIANGLTTLPPAEVYAFINNYLVSEEVEAFVVGHARQNSGADSESMNQIRPFVRSLQNKYPHIAVHLVDERFTSKLAFQAMLEGGLKKQQRQNKGLVDKVSAAIILQTFLEQKHNRKI